MSSGSKVTNDFRNSHNNEFFYLFHCGEVFFYSYASKCHCSIMSRGQTDKEHYVIFITIASIIRLLGNVISCRCGEPDSFKALRGTVFLTSLIIHTGKCHVGKYVLI